MTDTVEYGTASLEGIFSASCPEPQLWISSGEHPAPRDPELPPDPRVHAGAILPSRASNAPERLG
jgi:hypothetical protein